MENNNIVNDIERIVKENEVQLIESNGRTFATKDLVEIMPRKDVAKEIRFSDLSSIVEIVKREMERFALPIYINIETEKSVSVITSLDIEKEREKPYSAVAEGSRFNFGSGYDYERFVIAIRSQFIQTPNTANLLQLLKKVSNIESVETSDDGITQSVVAKQGAMLASDVKISPIIRLAPFRTFIEVEQPDSDFLFRISDRNAFALYEADGGAWKIKAKKNIRAFFEAALGDEIKTGSVVILG
jgi:hypothetical protein|nr:MAG TPA: hypothetical protein [Caudoviricetes sp.]